MQSRPAPNHRRLVESRCSRPASKFGGAVQPGPLLGPGQSYFRNFPPPVPHVLLVVLSSSCCFSWPSSSRNLQLAFLNLFFRLSDALGIHSLDSVSEVNHVEIDEQAHG